MNASHPIEDWIIYNKGNTPIPPVLSIPKVKMPEQTYICLFCGKINTYWISICEDCDAINDTEDRVME